MTTGIDESRQHDDPLDAPTAPEHGGHVSRWIFAIAGVAIVAGAIWAVRARSHGTNPNAAAPPPSERVVPVTEATVEQKDVPIWIEGLGNATPLYTVTVKSQVDGRLDRVLFKEGQSVKAGQVIAQIDPRPFQIALHNGEAALARDQATLRNAKLNLERYRTLVKQNLIPQQQVDDQQTAVDTATAATQADQTQIENSRLQLDYAAVKSPIDGVTGVRLVDPGNVVHAADQNGLVVITQLDPMAVLFTLPEDDLPRVQRELAKGQIAIEAWSRDGLTKLATGKLELIDNQVNQQTATIRLKAICPNPDRSLWPQQFVKARLLLSTQQGAIVVPAATVQRGPQGTFVYVIAADDTVSVRPVDVDLVQAEIAIIAKGLKPGERVVTDGQNQLRPGAKINARPPEKRP